MTERPLVLVAACALIDPDGRVLIAQRPVGKSMAGLWEFPGGKVEAGETPATCLRRELAEELGIAAEVGPEVHRTDYRSPNGFTVRLLVLKASRQPGVPENLEFERFVWVRSEELAGFDFLEADREVVGRLARGEVR